MTSISLSSRSSSPRNRNVAYVSSIKLWLCFIAGLALGHFHGRLSVSTEIGTRSANSLIQQQLSHLPTFSFLQATNHGGVDSKVGQSDWATIHVYKGDIAVSEVVLARDQTSLALPSSADNGSKGDETANTNRRLKSTATHNSDSSLNAGVLWFSQARQDQLVSALLKHKRNGFFVDLAANDAVKFSNTLALERNSNWHGLCIEPNPMYWYNLTMIRQNCDVVAAVVGQQRDEHVYFRFDAGDHGGVAGDGFDNGKRWQEHSTQVATVTLLEIFQRFHTPPVIDYLSLDVEGAEGFIMMNFPLDQYQIKIITAERLRGPIRTYLKQHGFEFVQKLTRWGESLWINKKYEHEMDMSAVENYGFPLF